MTKLTYNNKLFSLASTRLSITVQVYQTNMYTSHGRRYFSNKSSMRTSSAKVFLFMMRITISMAGVIICKSLFLTWYNDAYNWVEFCNNFYSLSSGLIAISCIAGGIINKLLDFTPLNVNVNVNMFLYDSTLKRLKGLKNLIWLEKIWF